MVYVPIILVLIKSWDLLIDLSTWVSAAKWTITFGLKSNGFLKKPTPSLVVKNENPYVNVNSLNTILLCDELPDDSCSICLEDFKLNDECIVLDCNENKHIFHKGNENCSGIKTWLERNNTCPMCRAENYKSIELANGLKKLLKHLINHIH